MTEQNFPEIIKKLQTKKVKFAGYTCLIKIRPYNSGRIFMTLNDVKDGMQVARVTLDTDAIPHIPNLVIIKSYSENEGVYEALLEAKVIMPCERLYAIGFKMAQVCFLNLQ